RSTTRADWEGRRSKLRLSQTVEHAVSTRGKSPLMRRLSSIVRLCASLLLATPTLLACDGEPTKHPEDEPNEDLGDGKLDGGGPGGIGGILGKADADPKVVEAEALLADGKYERGL